MAKTSKGYRLVAFDPGERTGYCSVKVSPGFVSLKATPKTFEIVDQNVLDVKQIMRALDTLIDPVDVVEYETWRLYREYKDVMVGNDMQPSQVVGMIRYEATKQGKKIVSNGADIKRIALGTMPTWLKAHMDLSSEQHDKDAIMHAWYVAWRRSNA